MINIVYEWNDSELPMTKGIQVGVGCLVWLSWVSNRRSAEHGVGTVLVWGLPEAAPEARKCT